MIVSTLNERIEKETLKLEQLKRQKRAMEQRGKKQERKVETRQKIIIGGIVVKYFPQLLTLQPKRTNEENDIEYTPLANFLSCLADKKDLVKQLEQEARQKKPADKSTGIN